MAKPAPLTLDPRTGKAVASGLASVTAILPWDPQGHAAVMVEAASLSALVLGPRDGMHLLGAQNAEGVLIGQRGAAWQAAVTPGLRGDAAKPPTPTSPFLTSTPPIHELTSLHAPEHSSSSLLPCLPLAGHAEPLAAPAGISAHEPIPAPPPPMPMRRPSFK